MNLTEITRKQVIASPSDLMTWADHLQGLNSTQGPMLFRGQPDTYANLSPTLTRSVQGGAYDAATLLERRLIGSFRKHYADLSTLPEDMPTPADVQEKSDIDLLSLMQHYEVPSRLLDWSESVWVATYFACASNSDKDAELWLMDSSLLESNSHELPKTVILDRIAASIGERQPDYHPDWGMPLFALVEPQTNSRLAAQRGRLTVSGNVNSDHAGLLWRLATLRHGNERTGESFGRYLIKSTRKRDILRFLADEKNVSAKTLFPDIVGLGRFLKWEFEALRMATY